MKLVIIVFAALLLAGQAATDATARGIYLGAGLGNTFFSSEVSDAADQIQNIDENATAWKIFAGFHAARFLGVEGGYRSFGTVSSTISNQTYESKTTGWDVEALGRVTVAIIDLFAKAGAMFWSHNETVLGQDIDENGTDFFWGLGAGVHLGPIGARLEWESVEGGGPDNLSMVSISATLGF